MSSIKKSADIHPLTRNHLPIGSTDPCIIDLLISLGKKAQHGELLGVAFSWVEGNNECVHQIVVGSSDASKLVASASSLFYDINKRWVES